MSKNWELAYEDYKSGMKYKDIAKKYNVSLNTVKSWKTRKWNNKSVHTNNEKACARNKDNISWINIENEYVTDIRKKPYTLKNLSEKYNVSFSRIEKYARENEWTLKRENYAKTVQEKTAKKTADMISNSIAKYKAKHLNISDKILDQIAKALSNDDELYTYVEKLRQGFAPGEFTEEIITQKLDSINDSKVVNLTNALDKIQKMQRQTLGILDAKDVKEEKIPDECNYKGIPSTMIAPAFSRVVFDIENREHLEYVFPGGRGSTKSSFISLEMIDLIMKNETMHACVLRQVGDTLRTSVYQQVKWAISALDLEGEFNCTISPLEITRKSTGQKIYFRGADDPDKIKSIKVPFGYIGIAWFEELDQFAGPEAVRKIEQSVVRGGDVAYIFKSFNPPKSANNWANKYIKIPKETRLVTTSTYLDVPKQWLGKPFLDEAEFLKDVNPDAYENEYMGVANGNGGNVFDNVEIREITDSEIQIFDRLYNGVDWGWFPDPWAFNRVHFDAARRTLYIFDEAHENKKSNKETSDILKDNHNVKPNDKITCDSSEQKSIDDYKTYGIFARPAIKGPGSVEYSMKWLASLNKIVIDNVRCPKTADEFLDYEYERDKEGNIISGYPDANNHHIDAVRYAMEEVWRRRGK